MARPAAGPAARTAPGSTCSASPSTAGPAGSSRGRCQAQRDQPFHRAPGTGEPRWRRGDLRCPPYCAGEPGLAGTGKKAHYIAVVKQNQPLLHARVRALPCGRSRPQRNPRRGHGRAETRTLKAAHVSGLDFPRPSGHQDHPVAAGHRHRQGLPPGRLRRHQPDRRRRHRGGPGPPGPRAVVHRGTPPRPRPYFQGRCRRQPHRQRSRQPGHHPRGRHRGPQRCGYLHIPQGRATTPAQPKPSAFTGSIRTDADIHGTRRSPALERARA